MKIIQTNTRTIVNSVSAGCTAYDDDFAICCLMENFINYVQLRIAAIINNKVLAKQVSASDNFEKATRCVAKNYRPHWAKWIRTGSV